MVQQYTKFENNTGTFIQENTVQDEDCSRDKLWLIEYIRRSIHLPTVISKFFNRPTQLLPHSDPLLTMYTSDTCWTCWRSTLHQGATFFVLCVIVHDPSASPNIKSVLLFPSTALLLLPSLYFDSFWAVGLRNAKFSWKEKNDCNKFLVESHQLLCLAKQGREVKKVNFYTDFYKKAQIKKWKLFFFS